MFINGDYYGLYCFTDKINRKLLGLKKYQETSTPHVRGLLYKGESWERGSDLLSYEEANVDTIRWNAFELKYPDDYPSVDTWGPLMSLIDFCSRNTPKDLFLSDWENFFYRQNIIDFYILCIALNIRDNGYKNTYLSVVDITKSHQYLITPWDLDISLGEGWDGSHWDITSEINMKQLYNLPPYKWLWRYNYNGFGKELIMPRNKFCQLFHVTMFFLF